jgi:hypothetical protein
MSPVSIVMFSGFNPALSILTKCVVGPESHSTQSDQRLFAVIFDVISEFHGCASHRSGTESPSSSKSK